MPTATSPSPADEGPPDPRRPRDGHGRRRGAPRRGARLATPELGRLAPALLALGMLACGPGDGPDAGDIDGGTDGGARVTLCERAADCDDGLFCNGDERCLIGDPAAGPDGCVDGAPPCASDVRCDEGARRCGEACATPDADGDGVAAIACGGDDCDDADANRYPENTEVCDPSGHDEDCDPTTFGARDVDGDGWVDAACCNSDGEEQRCGLDCDDASAAVSPAQPEVCDAVDQDCDAMVDEGVTVRCWQDLDEDGYAAPDAETVEVCTACPAGTTIREPVAGSQDCNDALDTAHDGAAEVCDGWDSDCGEGGGAVTGEDADGDGHTREGYTGCDGGPFPKDDCHDANADVHGGQTSYFAESFCPVGARYCAGCGCVTSLRCPFPTECTFNEGSWDYDCSGRDDPAPSVDTGCSMLPVCFGGAARCGTPHHRYAGTVRCGVETDYLACECAGGTCSGVSRRGLGCR